MTGMAAIAFCAAFTSCSKEITPMSEEEMVAIGVQKIYRDYEASFQKVFGTPAPGHTWGFSDVAGTRTENANANEWADPDKAYGGLLVPPPLTDAQIAVVKEYFQTVRNPRYQDPQWTNYFIQQVYKGYTDPKTGTDPNTGKPYSPERYLAADGNTWIYASNNMDHLAAINGSFVDHINNFNHGDCSPNGDVLDNGEHVGGKHHTDKIMYMKNSTTASFGYYNSNGSVRRTEYTGLVSYQTIIDALGSKANCLNDGWNRSFMGFDFEQMVGPEIQAQELDYSVPYNSELYGPAGFPSKGPKWYEFKGQKYIMLSSNQNMYCGTPYKKANGQDLNDSDMTDEFIASLLADGYLPVDGGANKKWVKVGGCADGYFSDWIVTLTEAKTTTPPPPSSANLRVMAEDLSANDEGKDFDFNDVVFDVYFSETVGEAYVMVQAAGGTLPLTVHGTEVHRLFGQPTNKMINTHAEDPDLGLNGISGLEPQKIQLTGIIVNSKSDVNTKVKIMVQKDVLVNGKNQKEWVELVNSGAAACKIGVPPTTGIAKERTNVNSVLDFNEWVTNGVLDPTYPNN